MKPVINADRLWQSLMETAQIGGTPDGGVCRLALSNEDRRIRDWFRAEVEKLGATVQVDAVGNVFALYPGRDMTAAPVAMGSHLDTQPTGGKFDGILGVLGGLEVLRTLHDNGIVPARPVVLVDWTNEEGARFAPAMGASSTHAGLLSIEALRAATDRDGISFGEALDAIGYHGEIAPGSQRLDAMFELHIEQGPVLEAEKTTIGVVTGVQGMRWYDLDIGGRASHAGTTPMTLRRDAFMTAAEVALETRALALAAGGYATIGDIAIPRASRNVVPGHVRLAIDIRHPEAATLDRIEAGLRALCDDPRFANTPMSLTTVQNTAPVVFDPDCVALVEAAATSRGLSARRMLSGAGHDSVHVSTVAPTAMIFVPCKEGISHNPAESATPEDCAAGVQVLCDAVLARIG